VGDEHTMHLDIPLKSPPRSRLQSLNCAGPGQWLARSWKFQPGIVEDRQTTYGTDWPMPRNTQPGCVIDSRLRRPPSDIASCLARTNCSTKGSWGLADRRLVNPAAAPRRNFGSTTRDDFRHHGFPSHPHGQMTSALLSLMRNGDKDADPHIWSAIGGYGRRAPRNGFGPS
jgi:hypothetical protein